MFNNPFTLIFRILIPVGRFFCGDKFIFFFVDYAEEKRQILEEETKMMLAKAKQAARMQMEIEKLNSNRFTTAIPPKASRFSYKFLVPSRNRSF